MHFRQQLTRFVSDALFQKAKMRDMAGYKVGWINGIVGKALEEGGAPMLLPVSNLSSNADEYGSS